jgi:hypothetical protein
VLTKDHRPGGVLEKHQHLAVLDTGVSHKIYHLIGNIQYIETTFRE